MYPQQRIINRRGLGAYQNAAGAWAPNELTHVYGDNSYYAKNPKNGATYFSQDEANGAVGWHTVTESGAPAPVPKVITTTATDPNPGITTMNIWEQPIAAQMADPTWQSGNAVMLRIQALPNLATLKTDPLFAQNLTNLQNQIIGIANGWATLTPSIRAGITEFSNFLNSYDTTITGDDHGDDHPIDYTDEQLAQNYITDLYRTLLGREPDAAGLTFYVNAILTSTNPNAQDVIRQEFLDSDEYEALHPVNDGGGDDTDDTTDDTTDDPATDTGVGGIFQDAIDYVAGMNKWVLIAGGVGIAYALGMFGDEKKGRR